MHPAPIKEIVSYKQLSLIKERLIAFVKKTDVILAISSTEIELEIVARSFSIYVQEDSERKSDILQVSIFKIKCYRVIFHFKSRNVLNEKATYFRKLEEFLIAFSVEELIAINASMPLINSYAEKLANSQFEDFALIWRDHFLEENVPLLQSFEKLGISAEWIFPLAKGDQTIKRARIEAYFRERGYYDVDTLRNLAGTTKDALRQTQSVVKKIERFIDKARRSGKKILIIDDGGLIANHFPENQSLFDCGIEVTVVGIRKLRKLKSIEIPIYDLGLSELKKIITYPEIAESCVKRIRELIPAEKISGRQILVLGYGTSGRHVARILRSIGAVVNIVDVDILKLIEASESGFVTYKTAAHALRKTKPFLVIGCTGEVSLTIEDLQLLENGVYLTGIATKDLETIRERHSDFISEWLPGTGFIHRLGDTIDIIQLGDGQSINLFMSEAIPNRANDVFKTGILISANELAKSYSRLKGGIYSDRVNRILKNSDLFEKYYDLYLKQDG